MWLFSIHDGGVHCVCCCGIQVLENYALSLKHGHKLIMQSLPRLLTLWYDFGKQQIQQPSKGVRKAPYIPPPLFLPPCLAFPSPPISLQFFFPLSSPPLFCPLPLFIFPAHIRSLSPNPPRPYSSATFPPVHPPPLHCSSLPSPSATSCPPFPYPCPADPPCFIASRGGAAEARRAEEAAASRLRRPGRWRR